MAYPPHGHQPPMPPGGPEQGPHYGYQAPHSGQPPQGSQPPYGNQPPPGSPPPYGGQPQYGGQPPHPGHAYPAPGQYNPHVMPPPGGKPGGSGAAVAVILSIVLVLVLGGAGAAFFLLSDSSSSTSADSDDGPDTGDGPERTEHEARFSIGNGPDDAPEVVIFADYNCGGCQAFDYDYGDTLRAAAHNGEIRLDIVSVNLTGESKDPQDYSSQAASIAACVYEAIPTEFGYFHAAVMQASYNSTDNAISIDDMLDIAVGEVEGGTAKECIENEEKADHAEISTEYAESNGVTAVPTIWVNEEVTQPEDVLDAIGE